MSIDAINKELDAMQARCDAATEGPWAVEFAGDFGDQSAVILCARWRGMLNTADFGEDVDTAQFVAHARTDMPRLIAALKAVLESHSPLEEDCLEWDCVYGECQHDEDPCPTVKVTLCDECHRLAANVWPSYGENGCGEVLYPCPTVKAVAKALGGLTMLEPILCPVCGHDIDNHDLGECCDCPGAGRGCHQWVSDIARAYGEERVRKQRAVVHVVAHENGDDMCGGLNLHGIYTSEGAAQTRLNEVAQEDFLGVEVYPIPLNIPGWLGYGMDKFESSSTNEEPMSATDPVSEARALLSAADGLADPRDWHVEHGRIVNGSGTQIASMSGSRAWAGDADLIAAAPRLLAALADEVERLRDGVES